MSVILTPIKVLLNMDVRTKSTYRAALEGIDQAFVETLEKIGYNPNSSDSTISLHRQPTDFRLEAAKKRLETFATNNEVGLFDFVKHARTTMHDFLDVIKLGFLNDLTMDDFGCLQIRITCMLHASGCEYDTSNTKKFEQQLKHLSDFGLTDLKKVGGTRSYRFNDTDNNRNIIRTILEERGARMIKMEAMGPWIDYLSFELDPKHIHKFSENPVDYTLPVTDELNDDEMIKLKKLVAEITSSLAFIKESPDMLQTCGFVAESSFSEVEEIVGFDGIISKRVKERHAKERAANMNIHEIEKEIGSNFPVEIARDVMKKIDATMDYFCVKNLHGIARNLQITQWGSAKMDIRIEQRDDELLYARCWFDGTQEPELTDMELMREVFDVVENRNKGIRLIDNEKNRKLIEEFLRDSAGCEIDSISVVRDNCFIETTTPYGTTRKLENVYVIDKISASTENIEKILELHEKCGIKKT